MRKLARFAEPLNDDIMTLGGFIIVEGSVRGRIGKCTSLPVVRKRQLLEMGCLWQALVNLLWESVFSSDRSSPGLNGTRV